MKLGATDIADIKLGTVGIAKVMFGADEVWSGEPPAEGLTVNYSPSDATVTIHGGSAPLAIDDATPGKRVYILESGDYGVMVEKAGYFTGHQVVRYDEGSVEININLEAEPDFDAMTQRYLDPVGGSDSNNGQTSGAAWKTMQHAMREAATLASTGVQVCVNVADGVITEENVSHQGASRRTTDHLIAFRAINPGNVIWTGADAVTNWTLAVGGPQDGLYYTPWTNDWGVPADPASGMAPIGRRREMVFVNDERMTQVYKVTSGEVYDEAATIAEVKAMPGSFYVDEAGDRIYLNPPAGVNPASLGANAIEVAFRSTAVYLQGYDNVVFKGFTFQRFASPITGRAVGTADQGGYWFLDCAWHQNNGAGWSFSSSAVASDFRFVRCEFTQNGIWAWGGSRATNVLLDTITEAETGWRAAQGGQLGWWVGNKLLYVHDVLIKDYVSRQSHVRVLWADTDMKNALVVNFDAQDGQGYNPIFLEAVQGPLIFDGLTLENNAGGGLQTSACGGLTLRNASLQNNATVQLNLSGSASSSFTSPVDGQSYTAQYENWDVQQCVIGDESGDWLILGGPSAAAVANLWSSSVFDYNTYLAPTTDAQVFRQGNGTTVMDFSGWQAYVGGEANSTIGTYAPARETGGLAVADAEDGDLSQFANTVTTPGNTFTSDPAAARFGTRGYLLAFNGSNQAYGTLTLPAPQDEVYVRLYFRLPTGWGFASAGDLQYFLSVLSGASELVRVQIQGRKRFVVRVFRPDIVSTDAYVGTDNELALDAWHLLEVRWVRHATSGGTQMWLNGDLLLNHIGTYDTSNWQATSVIVGANDGNVPLNGATIHIDQIKVDTQRVGPWSD